MIPIRDSIKEHYVKEAEDIHRELPAAAEPASSNTLTLTIVMICLGVLTPILLLIGITAFFLLDISRNVWAL